MISLRGFRKLALAAMIASLGIAGCATMQIRNIADPGEFARNLFRIAEDGNAREWGTQLTTARREMGMEYISRHYDVWRKSLLELKQAFGKPIEQVEFRLHEGTGLEFELDGKWHLIFRVTEEDGGLKINQD